MNSFEQNTTNRQKLTQIIDNLRFINENVTQISAIERDIILQNLRDAYEIVLHYELTDKPKSEEIIVETVENHSDGNNEPILEETETFSPENNTEVAEEVNTEAMIAETANTETPIEEPEIDLEHETTVIPAEPEKAEEMQPDAPELTTLSVNIEIQDINVPEATAPILPTEQTKAVATSILDDESDILEFLSAKISSNEDAEIEELDILEESKIEDVKEPELAQEEENPAIVQGDEPMQAAAPIVEKTFEMQKPEAPHSEKPKKSEAKTIEGLLFPDEPTTTPKRSLNDLLSQQKEDNSLSNKFQNAKVEDLSKAITVNDKFLYIRELFRNKGEEYSIAIQKLNKCQTIEEAFEEIELLKKYYFWDTTTAPYLSLCDLVRRKYQ
ncbi:MAG TPA: hypothetical protein PKK66_00940 [Bacteroidales bacterium]|nr:hypothetical protein [Bacteroidales bacterium]HPT51881.1 hypothetical protein [Bacteroidales bacterium]